MFRAEFCKVVWVEPTQKERDLLDIGFTPDYVFRERIKQFSKATGYWYCVWDRIKYVDHGEYFLVYIPEDNEKELNDEKSE